MEENKEKVFDITSLDIYKLLGLFINILSSQAWQYMGLRIRSGSDKVEKDLERAKVAIDSIELLISKIEDHVKEEEKTHLKNLLTDLQINFVRIIKS